MQIFLIVKRILLANRENLLSRVSFVKTNSIEPNLLILWNESKCSGRALLNLTRINLHMRKTK